MVEKQRLSSDYCGHQGYDSSDVSVTNARDEGVFVMIPERDRVNFLLLVDLMVQLFSSRIVGDDARVYTQW